MLILLLNIHKHEMEGIGDKNITNLPPVLVSCQTVSFIMGETPTNIYKHFTVLLVPNATALSQ